MAFVVMISPQASVFTLTPSSPSQELSLSSTPLLTSPPPLLPEDVKPKPKLMAPAPGTNEGAEPLATTAVERRDKDMAADEEGVASSPYGDWTRDEIASLKEGLRKYGRAWGKIYREVGGRKTATQCKQFYDELCTVEELGLQKALAEHSIMKVSSYLACCTGTCVCNH